MKYFSGLYVVSKNVFNSYFSMTVIDDNVLCQHNLFPLQDLSPATMGCGVVFGVIQPQGQRLHAKT